MSGQPAEDGTALSPTATIARDLIRFDTSNRGGGDANGEAEAAEYLGARLEAMGLRPEYFESAPRRTSLVARVPGRDPSQPALVVHGHTDVVPADPASWNVDPFAGEVRDGLLWGRGAVDMKDMDAMIVQSLADILDGGRLPERELVIAFFADEENGGVLGSHWAVEQRPELFAGATEAISEVGGYSVDIAGHRAYLLQTGEKALVWARLVAEGRAAHGSRVIRDNAVTRLAEAVVRIGHLDWPVRLTTTTEALLARLAELLPAQAGADPDTLILATGSAAGFLQATIRTTSNPTVLRAGYKHNVIPERAEALIDIRTLPGQEDEVIAEIRATLPRGVVLEILHRDIGLENAFGGELVDRMVRTLQRHDPGAHVLPYLMSGGTDNKALARLGIRGYGFAPLRLGPDLDFPAMFHGIDERVPLDALDWGTSVLTDFLLGE